MLPHNRHAPKYLAIPTAELARTELERCKGNLALIDLPFSRVNQLLKGLYARKSMGKRKPTLRRMVYAVFQLELHAWSISVEQQHKKRVKRKVGVGGTFLVDLRGLHFQLVMERLSLIHYGKHRCLSYADQVDEYQTEVRHISLQILQTCLSLWLFKKRIGRTVGGFPWPANHVWAKYPETFCLAMEGVANTRMRSLAILLGEVERKSKPQLMDVDLPPRVRLTEKIAAAEKDATKGCFNRKGGSKENRADDFDGFDVMDAETASGKSKVEDTAEQRKADATVLSSLTPEQVEKVYSEMDADLDGGLSPVSGVILTTSPPVSHILELSIDGPC